MFKKKIIVLGRGNAGCFTALHLSYYLPDHTLELIYDPDIPAEKVGQGSLVEVPALLWLTLGINWYKNETEAVPKFGTLYENWGKNNKYIFNPIVFSATAMHYDPKKLQDAILNSNLFKVTQKTINNPNKLKANYIFDCRGKKINDYLEYDILDNPLNAVILNQSNECDPRQLWTRAVATPDGWTFVIPNSKNTTSYGYLYNDNITSFKEASSNFNKLFKLKGKPDNFKFKNYVAKEPIQDNVILSGNRLFFLEPLEATAVQSYIQWARLCYDYIIGKSTKENIISTFQTYIRRVTNFIYWHYLSGSLYDTPFWEYAGKYKIKDKDFNLILDYIKTTPINKVRDERIPKNKLAYGQWAPITFKMWQDGIK